MGAFFERHLEPGATLQKSQDELQFVLDGVTHSAASLLSEVAGLGCICSDFEGVVEKLAWIIEHADGLRDMELDEESRVLYWIAYGVLEEAGFMEHGVSMPGWATPAGKEWAEAVREYLGWAP